MKKHIMLGITCLVILALVSMPVVGAFSWSSWFSWSKKKSGNKAPVVVMHASPRTGETPLMVRFSARGSYDPDGRIVKYYWDFGDGKHSILKNPIHTYRRDGIYKVKLTVTDNKGKKVSKTTTVTSNLGPYPPEQLKCNIPGGTGKGGVEYTCSCISGNDPFGNKVRVEFNWGDGTRSFTKWIKGGTLVQMNHTWPKNKPWEPVINYNIGARTWDRANATSIWTNMTISMPKYRETYKKRTLGSPSITTGLSIFGRRMLSS